MNDPLRRPAPDGHMYFALAMQLYGQGTTARGAMQNARFSGRRVKLPAGFTDWVIRLAPDISYVERNDAQGHAELVYPHCDCGNAQCVGYLAYLRTQEANDERT